MRSLAPIVLVLLLAGCSDPAPAKADDSFGDKPIEVDAQTGAIRGVVVDSSIVPVEGVRILLQGADVPATTTDANGRFTFSKLPPGFYMVEATKPLYESVTVQTLVEAGVREPPVLTVRMARVFSGEPFTMPFESQGYFTCSQASMPPYWYASSSCHDTYWVDLSDYGVVLPQDRDFHADVEDGWQTMVFEMTWDSSLAGTSERMGMVVSTYKPERQGSHWFANVQSNKPMRFQLDVGERHPTAGSTEPIVVPEEGLEQMSFFVSVRPPQNAVCAVWCVPPGLALEQSFHVYLHQFYYLPAPEGWSVVNGDPIPF